MKHYFKYLLYILEHKKNIFIESMKAGLYIHAFTHDMSKFYPSEFIAYANYFYGVDGKNNVILRKKFKCAWIKHQNRNKHHWDYWVDGIGKPIPMPMKYVKQMVVDWNGMGRKFGDTAIEYYNKCGSEMNVHSTTRYRIANVLRGLNV